MQHWFDEPNWVYGFFFVVFELLGFVVLVKGGFWFPRYVHAIALAAFTLGIAATLALPPPTNPDPLVRLVAPVVFPILFTVTAYVVPVLFGAIAAARQEKNDGGQEDSEGER